MKDVERILLGLALNRVERAVDDAFRDGLLALVHQAVHEFREHQIAIFGVGGDFAFLGTVSAGHSRFLRLFSFRSRLAPGSSPGLAGMTATRSFRPLCSVDGTALFAVLDALAI